MKAAFHGNLASDYGLNPAFMAALMNLTEPESLLWSVKAMAGMPKSAALSTSLVIPEAPSRKEYGLCTWRWYKHGLIKTPCKDSNVFGFK